MTTGRYTSVTSAFVGFAPSYYLRSFSPAPPLTTLVHLHGMAATAWMLLALDIPMTKLREAAGLPAGELERISVVVGKEGKINNRLSVGLGVRNEMQSHAGDALITNFLRGLA